MNRIANLDKITSVNKGASVNKLDNLNNGAIVSKRSCVIICLLVALIFFSALSSVDAKSFNSTSTQQEVQNFLSNTSDPDQDLVFEEGNYSYDGMFSILRNTNITTNGGVKFTGSGSYPLFILSEAYSVNVEGLDVSGYSSFMELYSPSEVIIANSKIKTSGGFIQFLSASKGASANIINNTIDSSYFVRVDGANNTNVVVENNTISNLLSTFEYSLFVFYGRVGNFTGSFSENTVLSTHGFVYYKEAAANYTNIKINYTKNIIYDIARAQRGNPPSDSGSYNNVNYNIFASGPFAQSGSPFNFTYNYWGPKIVISNGSTATAINYYLLNLSNASSLDGLSAGSTVNFYFFKLNTSTTDHGEDLPNMTISGTLNGIEFTRHGYMGNFNVSSGNNTLIINYAGQTSRLNFYVKSDINTTVPDIIMRVNQQSNITGQIINYPSTDSTPISKVNVTVAGVRTEVNVNNNQWILPYTPVNANGGQFIVSFAGNNLYNGFQNTGYFTVSSTILTSSLGVNESSATVGDVVRISGQIEDYSGQLGGNNKINLTIGNKVVEVTVNPIDGTWYYDYQTQSPGSIMVSISHTDSDIGVYILSNDSLFLIKDTTNSSIIANSTITVFRETTISGKLTNPGNGLDYIYVQVGNDTYMADVEADGSWSIVYTPSTIGSLNIRVWNDNINFTSEINTSSFNVVKIKINSTIIASDLVVGRDLAFSGIWNDSVGNTINVSQISFTLSNGTKYNSTSNNASTAINILTNGWLFGTQGNGRPVYKAGSQNITLTFIGNNFIDPFDVTYVFNVVLNASSSTISHNATTATKIGNLVRINGTVSPTNVGINTVNLTVDGVTTLVSVGSGGAWTYNYTVTSGGTIPVLVTFNGNANVTEFFNMTTFIVTKSSTRSNITAVPTSVHIGENVLFSGQLVNYTNITFVVLEIGNESYSVAVNSTGGWSYNYATTTIGNSIQAIVKVAGNAYYNDTSNSTTFTVLQNTTSTNINVNPSTVNIGTKVIISGTITNKTGIHKNNIFIYINNTLIGTASSYDNITGEWSFNYGSLFAGNNIPVNAVINHSYYPIVNVSSTFSVVKNITNSTIIVNNIVQIGTNILLEGYVINHTNLTSINITIKNSTGGIVSSGIVGVDGGYWYYPYLANTSDIFTIEAILPVNPNYVEGKLNSTNFQVNKNITNSTIVINPPTPDVSTTISIGGQLTQYYNVSKVNVTLPNGTTVVANVNGSGYWNIASYTVNINGKNTITASLTETSHYLGFTNEFSFSPGMKVTNSTINIVPSPANIGNGVIISGQFSTFDENITSITITVNGTTYIVPVSGTGSWSLTYNTTVVGNISINASLTGNEHYLDFSNSSSFIVNRNTTGSTINLNPNITGLGSNVVISGTLTNKSGITANNISIYVNGTFIGNPTSYNSTSGLWTMDYLPNSLGNNISVSVTISHANYTYTSNSTLLNVVKSTTNSSIDIPQPAYIATNITISGNITNRTGITKNNINVTINGNSVVVNSYDLSTGIWTVNYLTGSIGNYTVVVQINETAYYFASTNTTVFEVIKYSTNSSIIISPNITTVGNNVTVSGQIANYTGVTEVNVTIDSNLFTVSVNASGYWSLNYTTNRPGSVNVLISGFGYENYADFINSSNFYVLKNSRLFINPVEDTKVNTSININGTLSDEDGNPITGVTINVAVSGTNYTITTDAEGKWDISYFVNSTGIVNVVAYFVGNDNYTAAANSTSFYGLALNSTLVINPVPATKTENNVSINGTLLDEKNNPISGVTVNVTVDSVHYATTTDAEGKWGITYLVVSTGSISIIATFDGNTYYNSSINSSSFSGVGLSSNLTINPIPDTKINSTVSINGTLLDENNDSVSGVTVNVTVNNVVYSATTNSSGHWNVNYLVISTGSISVVAEFEGNTGYVGSSNSTSFNGLALNSTLVINYVPNSKINGSVSINGTLLDENGYAISGVTVSVTVNNVVYIATTNNSGNWSITYLVNSTNLTNVVAEFVGNDNYTGAANSTSFYGVLIDTILVINLVHDSKVNSSVSVNGALKDEYGNNVSGVTVIVTVDGTSYNSTTDSNGNWNITHLVNSSSEISVVATFIGDVNYTAAANSTEFGGLLINTTLVINSVPDSKVNSSVSVNGTLKDEYGNDVSGVTVIVTVNGFNYTSTTDNNGNWNITYLVNSTDPVNIVATFVGDVNYTAAVNSTEFGGVLINTTLVINPVPNSKVNSSVSVNGTLKDEYGDNVSGVTVIVTVDGFNYTSTTDSNGNWNITYLVNSSSEISVVATFIGDVNYTVAVNSTEFGGVLINTILVINSVPNSKVNSSVSVNGTLKDEYGDNVSGVTVIVTVDGFNYTSTTDSNGNWNITYLVNSSSEISVVATFVGDVNYAAAVNSTEFGGVLINTILVINSVPDSKVNSSVSVNGTLKDEYGDNVSGVTVIVTVDGFNYTSTTDSNGNWDITYLVNSSSEINVIATFIGDVNYTAAANNTEFAGVLINTTLVINLVHDSKVNSSVSVNGTLKDEYGNNVSGVTVMVTVDGFNYTSTTDSNGNWNITYIVNSSSEINVIATFIGDVNYTAAANSTEFGGVLINTTLVINPVPDSKVNSSVSVNGTLKDEYGNNVSGVT
ncbi:beta strand repeat-containing protein, partial [Methanobrevibacter filiformis]|uniref:beta strand repeat-containing protein n=1 Tax=Methanobrevibacter filiformis TaxID=55758 RepID=UPI000A6C8A3C